MVALSVAVILVSNTAFSSEGNDEPVRKAAEQFYAALNSMFTGDLGPMEEIWSHAEDVTYLDPGGGYLVGWEEVLASWKAQAAMKLGGKVEATEMRITVGRDLAVTQNYETGENMDEEGKIRKVSIRATNVFRKEDGEWKMIGHHTDLVPFLGN